ncbi:MAG: glutathione peroxidase [Bacteroidia bacterium]
MTFIANYIAIFLCLLLQTQSFFSFSIKDIDGQIMKTKDFKGKKILIVNTASKCGYTPQYAELQELSVKYKDKLVVIAFPANNFLHQEPGNNEEIKTFCTKNYGVTFPVASKVSVKGDDIDPLFKWLTEQPNPDFTGSIKWNFEKFLLDENGNLIHRYRSGTKPMDPAITNAL